LKKTTVRSHCLSMSTQSSLVALQEMTRFLDGIDSSAEFMEEWEGLISSIKLTHKDLATRLRKAPREP